MQNSKQNYLLFRRLSRVEQTPVQARFFSGRVSTRSPRRKEECKKKIDNIIDDDDKKKEEGKGRTTGPQQEEE
jgi:hypothetical protein